MKGFAKAFAALLLLGLPLPASAQQSPTYVPMAPPASLSSCNATSNMNQMQANMSDMTQDMDSMIRNTSDRATSSRLRYLRDQMSDLASDMNQIAPNMCNSPGAPLAPPQ
jgi:hypothetical protein